MPSPWQTGKIKPKKAPSADAAIDQRRPPKPERQAVDSKEFRDAMGYFATGITIISSVGPKGELIGVTANSFNSVSLEPPLVLFSLSRSALSWRSFLSTQYFAVNVLSRRQHALSTQFAKTSENKWKGVEHEFWQTGCPVIKDCLAAFECEIRYTHDGGDHIIFVGEVLRMKSNPEYRPLLFYRGQYRDLAEQDQDG